MHTQRKRLYTGRMELHNGWELRPYAYRTENGYVPELSTRKHQPGSAIDIVTLDMTCCTRDDAIAAAMKHGLCLVAALAYGSSL
jgi:hypothetical protein